MYLTHPQDLIETEKSSYPSRMRPKWESKQSKPKVGGRELDHRNGRRWGLSLWHDWFSHVNKWRWRWTESYLGARHFRDENVKNCVRWKGTEMAWFSFLMKKKTKPKSHKTSPCPPAYGSDIEGGRRSWKTKMAALVRMILSKGGRGKAWIFSRIGRGH